MKPIILAGTLLLASACSAISGLTGPSGPPSGFTEEAMSGERYRIVYNAPGDASTKVISDRTLARAAQITLEKGNEWFEVTGKISGKNTQTLVIRMGKGETLAGGPKQYNAKETLSSLKGKIG